MVVIQPVYEIVSKTAAKAGVDLAELSGSGHAEVAVISDIWRASRGELTLAQVVRNHGFHGPQEGEISGRVWREDDTPLRRLIEHYASRDDSEDPWSPRPSEPGGGRWSRGRPSRRSRATGDRWPVCVCGWAGHACR